MYFVSVFCVAIMLILLRFGPRNELTGERDGDGDEEVPVEGTYYQSSINAGGGYAGSYGGVPIAGGGGSSPFEVGSAATGEKAPLAQPVSWVYLKKGRCA